MVHHRPEMRLKSLEVHGFKALADVRLDFEALNVVLGPNGSGKSSLMDVFALLADAMQERLSDALSARGGISELLTRERATEIRFTIELESKRPAPLVYTVILAAQGLRHVVKEETLTQIQKAGKPPFIFLKNTLGRVLYHDPKTSELREPDWKFVDAELALAQAPRMYQEPDEFRRALASVHRFTPIDVGERAPVRLSQALRPVGSPGPNGEDLLAFLYQLRSIHSDAFERLEDVLRTSFPGFERIDFPLVGQGQAALAWYEKHTRRPFFQTQLSEGQLRFLWLASLLLSPDLPVLTMIDEPEVSLHPELVRVLADLLREAAMRSQVIVATHSDRLVRWLNEHEIVIADREDGKVQFRRATEIPSLDSWLENYTLDQLWLMGELGGRP